MLAQLFKSLFLATLFITFVVNIMFLVGTKDKPPDAVVVSDQSTDHRRLFMRSGNTADLNYNLVGDYVATANEIKLGLNNNDTAYDNDNKTSATTIDVSQSGVRTGAKNWPTTARHRDSNRFVSDKSSLLSSIPVDKSTTAATIKEATATNKRDLLSKASIIATHDNQNQQQLVPNSGSVSEPEVNNSNNNNNDNKKENLASNSKYYYYTQVPSPTTIRVAHDGSADSMDRTLASNRGSGSNLQLMTNHRSSSGQDDDMNYYYYDKLLAVDDDAVGANDDLASAPTQQKGHGNTIHLINAKQMAEDQMKTTGASRRVADRPLNQDLFARLGNSEQQLKTKRSDDADHDEPTSIHSSELTTSGSRPTARYVAKQIADQQPPVGSSEPIAIGLSGRLTQHSANRSEQLSAANNEQVNNVGLTHKIQSEGGDQVAISHNGHQQQQQQHHQQQMDRGHNKLRVDKYHRDNNNRRLSRLNAIQRKLAKNSAGAYFDGSLKPFLVSSGQHDSVDFRSDKEEASNAISENNDDDGGGGAAAARPSQHSALVATQSSTNSASSSLAQTHPSTSSNNRDPTVLVNGVTSSSSNSANKLNIKVLSSKNRVYVKVNNILIYDSNGGVPIDSTRWLDSADSTAGRGIHLIVLNEFNGNVLAKRVFDTYSPHQDDELSLFVKMIRDGRILIFAIKDEATFQMSTKSSARLLIRRLGSDYIMQLKWRDMWAMVTKKQTRLETNLAPGQTLAPINRGLIEIRDEQNSKQILGYQANYGESISRSAHFVEWGPALLLEANVTLVEPIIKQQQRRRLFNESDGGVYSYEYYYYYGGNDCDWNSSHGDKFNHDNTFERRQNFCNKLEGYGSVCDCKNPAPITFKPRQIENSQIDKIPVIVMASNRPYYLYRMLRTLLAADGVNSSMITVFIDGYYDEPLMVTRLFNLRAVQHTPSGYRSARISQHYRASLTAIFEMFPKAEHVIIIEEDLDVSEDFFVYFNQTISLLDNDPSLYCISAWNDQGYDHTSKDNSLLYRVESMPGLGWLLQRKLYKEELESRWPSIERQHDWDMWIRTSDIRKGRECLVPDVSRTYHFGSKGINMNSYFQGQYFSKHAINMIAQYKFRDLQLMTKDAYEDLIVHLVRTGHVITEADMLSSRRAHDSRPLSESVQQFPSSSASGQKQSVATSLDNNHNRNNNNSNTSRQSSSSISNESRENFAKFLCSLADTDDDQLSSNSVLQNAIGSSFESQHHHYRRQQQLMASGKTLATTTTPDDDDDADDDGTGAPLARKAPLSSNVIFIDMIEHNNYTTWLKLAKCWHIWDLDARGQHNSMWRLFLNGRHTLVIGVPASPYSKLMPANLMPFSFI